jgi:hypothetical protein
VGGLFVVRNSDMSGPRRVTSRCQARAKSGLPVTGPSGMTGRIHPTREVRAGGTSWREHLRRLTETTHAELRADSQARLISFKARLIAARCLGAPATRPKVIVSRWGDSRKPMVKLLSVTNPYERGRGKWKKEFPFYIKGIL